MEGNDQVQAGLPAQRSQDGIRPLLIYYALEEFQSAVQYILFAIDVSVIIVAGFRIDKHYLAPLPRSDWHAWDPE